MSYEIRCPMCGTLLVEPPSIEYAPIRHDYVRTQCNCGRIYRVTAPYSPRETVVVMEEHGNRAVRRGPCGTLEGLA